MGVLQALAGAAGHALVGAGIEASHTAARMAWRALAAQREAWRRAHETADETAARHHADDVAYFEWLARVRRQRGPTR